jgi:flagellar basal-body rod protein FlgG
MEALQTKLDVIAHNLANVNTTGFKRGRANFEDLLYQHEVLPGAQDSEGNLTATGSSIGIGTRVSSIQTDFKQGAMQQTGNPLDVAIQGDGFFEVNDPATGGNAYTRSGNLARNANGELVLASDSTGRIVQPPVTIPIEATGVAVNPDGRVVGLIPGDTELTEFGQLQIATFINPEGLLKLGENLYQPTEASGTATLGDPSSQGFGQLQGNHLEASNVEPVQELINLITTQRSFELNSQAVQAGDQVLQLISNLSRN